MTLNFKYLLLFKLMLITSLKSELYISGSLGAAGVSDLKLKTNDEISFTGTDGGVETVEEIDLGIIKAVQRTTITTNYKATLKNYELAPKEKLNPTISGAIGYRFNNSLRLESEYRYIRMSSLISSGQVNLDAEVLVNVRIEGPGGALIIEQDQNQYISLPISIEDLLDPNYSNPLMPGSLPLDVSFSHGLHIQMFNLLYDAPITENLYGFGGGGLGIGFLSFYDETYPDGLEVRIKPEKSNFFAYQAKVGVGYKLSSQFDALLTYTFIQGLNSSNIGAFTYEPMSIQTAEFGIAYRFQ